MYFFFFFFQHYYYYCYYSEGMIFDATLYNLL